MKKSIEALRKEMKRQGMPSNQMDEMNKIFSGDFDAQKIRFDMWKELYAQDKSK